LIKNQANEDTDSMTEEGISIEGARDIGNIQVILHLRRKYLVRGNTDRESTIVIANIGKGKAGVEAEAVRGNSQSRIKRHYVQMTSIMNI